MINKAIYNYKKPKYKMDNLVTEKLSQRREDIAKAKLIFIKRYLIEDNID